MDGRRLSSLGLDNWLGHGDWAQASPCTDHGATHLEGNPFIQSRLMRPPLRPEPERSGLPEAKLVQQLGCLVSTKGSDLMLTAARDEIQSYQRLRRTVNAKMWRWQVVSGAAQESASTR